MVALGAAPADEPLTQRHRLPSEPETANHQEGFGYRGSAFFKIVGDEYLLAGDITNNDGTGGKSIWGGDFEDDGFTLRHRARHYVSMWNRGTPDSNNSQLLFTLKPLPELDETNVVVGRVLGGGSVLDQIVERARRDDDGVIQGVTITNSRAELEPYLLEE